MYQPPGQRAGALHVGNDDAVHKGAVGHIGELARDLVRHDYARRRPVRTVDDAERDRERDLSPRPSEFRLKRRDDDARRRPHRLRREKREERDDDNDPCVVEALHG